MTIYRTTVDGLKTQAKRLRTALAAKRITIGHAQSLDLVSSMYGYKNWNAAVAQLAGAQKLYVVLCAFAKDEDHRRSRGFFDFYVTAASPDEAEALCLRELPRLNHRSGETEAFSPGDQIFIDQIVEVNSVPEHGAVLNYRSFGGDVDFISNMAPCEDPEPQIRLFTTLDPDREQHEPVKPALVLGRSTKQGP